MTKLRLHSTLAALAMLLAAAGLTACESEGYSDVLSVGSNQTGDGPVTKPVTSKR